MEQLKCTECGQVFDKTLKACPNCGCPASECETIATKETTKPDKNSDGESQEKTQRATPTPTESKEGEARQRSADKSESNFSIRILPNASEVQTGEYLTVSQLLWSCQFHRLLREMFLEPCDFGQRIYEIFELWWECVLVTWMCITKKFAKFSGRASRREYFSCFFSDLWFLFLYLLYYLSFISLVASRGEGAILIIIGFLILFIVVSLPWISVSVRRMHDINRSGWWAFVALVPFIGWFFQLKKSDEGVNRYGAPNPEME